MTGAVTHTAVDPAKADALLETMRAAGAADTGDRVVYLEQLEGGWSRHSYAARVVHADGEREYIVRARPQGSTLDTDLGQEFRVYSLLDGRAGADARRPRLRAGRGHAVRRAVLRDGPRRGPRAERVAPP